MRALLILPLLLACEDELPTESAPRIESARPAAAGPGEVVTLVGRNFGRAGPFDAVRLAAAPVSVAGWTDRAIEVVVPEEYPPGFFDFIVKTEGRVSAPFTFEVVDRRPAERDASVEPD